MQLIDTEQWDILLPYVYAWEWSPLKLKPLRIHMRIPKGLKLDADKINAIFSNANLHFNTGKHFIRQSEFSGTIKDEYLANYLAQKLVLRNF